MKIKDYYIMKERELDNVVKPKGITKTISPRDVQCNNIQFFDEDPVQFYIEDKSGIVYPDFIQSPVPLISNNLWEVFYKLKMQHIFYKPVVLADIKKMKQTLYWLIIPKKINCLSEETLFNKDNSLKKLVIKRDQIGFFKVFKIHGILEDYIIVDTEVVEIIENSDLSHVVFQKIQVEG